MQSQHLTTQQEFATVQEQMNLLRAERIAKTEALGIPVGTPPGEIAKAAANLVSAELARQERLVDIDLQLAGLETVLAELEGKLRQEQQQKVQVNVDAARESIASMSQELHQLVARINEIVSEARQISSQIAPGWGLSGTRLPFLQQLPDFRMQMPVISPSSLGNFIMSNTER